MMIMRSPKMTRRKHLRSQGRGFFLLAVVVATVIVYFTIKLTTQRDNVQAIEVQFRFGDYTDQKKAQLAEDNDYTLFIRKKNPIRKPADMTSPQQNPVTTSATTTTSNTQLANNKNEWFQNPIYKCKNNPPFLLVLIGSLEDHQESRDTIRETWCKDKLFGKGRSVQCIFMIGHNQTNQDTADLLMKESSVKRDLIIQNFADTERNSSRKMMLGMRWAEEFCPQASFVMKTEDDVIVNLNVIMEMLTQKDATLENFATGRCWSESPNRNPESRYYVSREQFAGEKYPVYCSTMGFLMSADVTIGMNRLYRNGGSDDFPLDDVLAGIFWRDLGVKPINNNAFIIGGYDKENACKHYKDAAIIHIHMHDVRKVWKTITSCK